MEIGLTYVYGIGRSRSNEILNKSGINPDTRCRDLTESEVSRLRELIDGEYVVEGDLRRDLAMNIKRLQEIGSYRGMRHRRGLPVRGQRTRTNARTRKGRPKTVAGRKRASAKKVTKRRRRMGRARRGAHGRRVASDATCRWGAPISSPRSTTRSSPLPIRAATSSPALCGPVLQGLAQSTVRRAAGRQATTRTAMDNGCARWTCSSRAPAPGAGGMRTIQNTGLKVRSITDSTPIPHNGCRPPKKRRI